MSGDWVAIQRNPKSGTGRRRFKLLELMAALRRYGVRPRVFARRERLDERLRDQDLRDRLVCLVAAGGDGTIADVVNRYHDLPICPFPLGTENVLCRYLNIPADGEAVAEAIVRGRQIRFDLGRVGDRHFTLMASAGFDAEVVHRVHAARRGNISQLAYAGPLSQAMWHYQFPLARVFVDNESEPLVGSLVMVFNMPRYGFGLPIVPQADGTDGLLDVAVFQKPGIAPLVRYGLDVMAGQHFNRPDVVYRRAQQLRIESDTPIPLQVDGDPIGSTPCQIQVEPQAMRLVVI